MNLNTKYYEGTMNIFSVFRINRMLTTKFNESMKKMKLKTKLGKRVYSDRDQGNHSIKGVILDVQMNFVNLI